MDFAVLRQIAVALGVTVAVLPAPAWAQSGDSRTPAQQGQGDRNGASQRRIDEIAEVGKSLTGPAANPECVWLGRRVVSLLWRDDLDTAFRHLDLYDRFGCPGGHVQATFRCLTRFGAQIDDKVPRSLDDRVHACWINPNAQPQAAAAQPPAPVTTSGNAAPAPAAAPPAPAAK